MDDIDRIDRLRKHAGYLNDFTHRGPGRIPAAKLKAMATDLQEVATMIEERALHWVDAEGVEWCPLTWTDSDEDGQTVRHVKFVPVAESHGEHHEPA